MLGKLLGNTLGFKRSTFSSLRLIQFLLILNHLCDYFKGSLKNDSYRLFFSFFLGEKKDTKNWKRGNTSKGGFENSIATSEDV